MEKVLSGQGWRCQEVSDSKHTAQTLFGKRTGGMGWFSVTDFACLLFLQAVPQIWHLYFSSHHINEDGTERP